MQTRLKIARKPPRRLPKSLGNIMNYSDSQYKYGFWGGFANEQFGSVISELSEFKGEKKGFERMGRSFANT